MAKTAVALYDTKNEAQQVVNELTNAGFSRSNIQLQTKQDRDSIDALTSAGLPRQNAEAYQEGVRRGGHLIIVTTANDQIDTAVEVMERYESINVQERAEIWQREGGGATGTSSQRQSRQAADEATIPVVEEELRVGKRQVERGGVRVNTHIIEQPVEETVSLHEEHVNVERRPVNRAATASDFDTFEEGTLEFTETAEEAVIDKRARVAEEVVISKEGSDRQKTVRDTVRHTEVEVDRIENNGSNGNDFATYREGFRKDYSTNYASSGLGYDAYEPAYQYGYTLRNRKDMGGRSWHDVESQARKDWEKDQKGPWENFKDAVRHGWESVRN